mgnify:CR=1 FL=1
MKNRKIENPHPFSNLHGRASLKGTEPGTQRMTTLVSHPETGEMLEDGKIALLLERRGPGEKTESHIIVNRSALFRFAHSIMEAACYDCLEG